MWRFSGGSSVGRATKKDTLSVTSLNEVGAEGYGYLDL